MTIGVNLKTDGPCPACWGATFGLESQRELLLDLAKKSILDKLHLSQRPTLSRPVSRGALKTALQRLRGSRRETLLDHDQRQEEYEIISFADTESSHQTMSNQNSERDVKDNRCLSGINQTRLEFHFSGRTAGGMEVLQTRFMFFVQFPPNATRTVNIRVLVLRPHSANLTWTGQHVLQVDASGWHQLLLGPEAQVACSQGHLTLELVPESQGAHSSLILGGFSHRPFVAAQVRVEGKHRVHRRGIDCQGVSRMCCRQEFFVDFREIGWSDWIIQPEGYAMNFCTGQCPLHVAGMPGISASFHTAVLNLLKANGAAGAAAAGGGSCCVPTSRRPLSLLYYDRDSNIVKTDIPDMVVEACGCS
ncbi:Inhibin beta C chain [Apodemus speciosus]|uniref:Inhibin beta C chain n=1 Tax=Apodemus speciosus TaxID=105296 RepID=A0ABQ0F9D8_APOSI